MRKLFKVVVVVMFASQAYAGNGDLIVNGKLGVGVTSPAAKLDVAGGIKFGNGSFGNTAYVAENGWLRDAWLTGQGVTNIRWDDTSKKWKRWSSGDPVSCYGYNDFGGILHNSNKLSFVKGACGAVAEWNNSDFYNNFEKMTITDTGNVGIGTTAPNRKLELLSDVAGISVEAGTGSPNSGAIRFGDNTGWKLHIGRSRNSGGGPLNTGTQGVLLTVNDNGNVGIGTTNPVGLLTVGNGTYPISALPGVNIAANGSSYLTVSDNTRQVLLGADASGYGMIGTYSNHDFVIRTNNTEKIRVSPSGNVGIGTTGPGYKLDVVGDIRAQNGWLRTTGSTGWYSDTYGGGWYMGDSTWIRSYNNKNVWVDATLGSNGGLTVGYGGAGSPAGGAIIAGNVGIGTTNPGSKLHVAASGKTAIYASTDSSFAVMGYSSSLVGVFGIGEGILGTGVQGRGTTYDFLGGDGEYGKNGVWSNGSDRNIKENFINVENQTILEKISQLPMTQWNYISDVKKSKHVGPIAQDFYAIFGLGDDEKHISTIDPAGIALVGVKALNEKIQDQQKQIDELRAEIKAMKKQR